jgi:hypothetical protein
LLFLQLRFMVFIYVFIPFIVPFLFIKNGKFRYKISITNSILFILVIASFYRFFYGISHANFQYNAVIDLLTYSPVMYFF